MSRVAENVPLLLRSRDVKWRQEKKQGEDWWAVVCRISSDRHQLRSEGESEAHKRAHLAAARSL